MRASGVRVFFAAAGAALCSIAALAQPAAEPAGARAEFASLDRNRDGYLSKHEAGASREIAKRFHLFDIDGDGRLSEREFLLAKEDDNKRMVRDASITERVRAALLAEKALSALPISVDTYEGRVQLSGFAGSPDVVSRAGRITAAVDGVRTVSNNIAVR